jgi:hypothetical protein
MVPAFAREQQGFDVLTVAIEKQDSEGDAIGQVRATGRALARLEANARHPNRMGAGGTGKVFLDISSHSRACKGG